MKIVNIETIPYAIPVKNFTDAYAGFSHSNAVLIRIHTDEGLVGIGEACAWEPEFYGETVESIYTSINNYVGTPDTCLNPRNTNTNMNNIPPSAESRSGLRRSVRTKKSQTWMNDYET